jgi:hypothetical protein
VDPLTLAVPPGFQPVNTPATRASDDSEVSVDTTERRLNDFISKVTRKRDPPLISEPPQQPPAKTVLPQRSRRQAAHPLSQVPASKRGEVLIKQR